MNFEHKRMKNETDATKEDVGVNGMMDERPLDGASSSDVIYTSHP